MHSETGSHSKGKRTALLGLGLLQACSWVGKRRTLLVTQKHLEMLKQFLHPPPVYLLPEYWTHQAESEAFTSCLNRK